LWKVRPASVKHLKVFGSKCFIKRNDKNPRKYDSLTDKGIFLRYPSRSKGYKCYNKRKKKIEDYIDVIVDKITSQSKSSKINMNLDDEESLDMRSMDLEETNLDSEGEEESTTSRPKTPYIYVQKEHLEIQIL